MNITRHRTRNGRMILMRFCIVNHIIVSHRINGNGGLCIAIKRDVVGCNRRRVVARIIHCLNVGSNMLIVDQVCCNYTDRITQSTIEMWLRFNHGIINHPIDLNVYDITRVNIPAHCAADNGAARGLIFAVKNIVTRHYVDRQRGIRMIVNNYLMVGCRRGAVFSGVHHVNTGVNVRALMKIVGAHHHVVAHLVITQIFNRAVVVVAVYR